MSDFIVTTVAADVLVHRNILVVVAMYRSQIGQTDTAAIWNDGFYSLKSEYTSPLKYHIAQNDRYTHYAIVSWRNPL